MKQHYQISGTITFNPEGKDYKEIFNLETDISDYLIYLNNKLGDIMQSEGCPKKRTLVPLYGLQAGRLTLQEVYILATAVPTLLEIIYKADE